MPCALEDSKHNYEVFHFESANKRCVILCAGLLALAAASARAGWEDARDDLIHGKYESAITQADKGLEGYSYQEEWHLIKIKAQMELGRYEKAGETLTQSLRNNYRSLRLRMLGYDVLRHLNQPDEALRRVYEINQIASDLLRYRRSGGIFDPEDFVALGRAAVVLGADPRLVKDNFYDVALQSDEKCRSAYLALGDLALSKNDYQVASETFQRGLKQFEDDPDLLYGLAKAFQPSDQKQMLLLLRKALEQNDRHVPSYLLLADHLINAEQFDAADETLETALKVNPREPKTWAYKAALAHFHNEPDQEKAALDKALETWKSNPAVYHLVGLKLSQRYRFREGADYQRQALLADLDYLPAKIQLAQDLLRLGREQEGWELAQEVYDEDGYNVSAFNLVTLHDSISHFQTLTNEDFIVRMAPLEARLYGDRVLDLLNRAKARLCAKYGFEPTDPVTVEIFPNSKDFGVRTFGMPDNPGYLGVCFGPVITANSPASQAPNPANWEAVLWHEFCHVVTLHLTRNKMLRWLSEGISVYEERLANPTWGQWMNRDYRQLIEKDGLTPVGELSSAFLAPEDNLHLQFAYYESSIVVEYLVEHYGLQNLKKLLVELGEGTEINEAIEMHMAPLKEVEKGFDEFAKNLAKEMAPELDFEKPEDNPFLPDDVEVLETMYSNNYWVLRQKAQRLMSEEKWEEAKAPLEKLIELYPKQTERDSAYALMAAVHRQLNEIDEEHEMLEKIVSLVSDAHEALSRLMELDSANEDWLAVTKDAQRYLAINPLKPQPYQYLADASEHTGDDQTAINAYQALLELDPADPAHVHYRLAVLLERAGDPAAKRHVLQALEEAPRFRDAHKLLLKIVDAEAKNET